MTSQRSAAGAPPSGGRMGEDARRRRTDPIILAEDCVIDGGIGQTIPNYNVLVVGCTGSGKSLSVNYPTMFEMREASMIANFPKAGEARQMAEHFREKGYRTLVLDLSDPGRSTVGFDPLQYVSSYNDIDELAAQSVMSVIQKTADDYWQRKAVPLIGALIAATLMTVDNATFADVLDLFDRLHLTEDRYEISTDLDDFFERLKASAPDSYAVREFYNFRSLPVKTASCVRDTAAACLSAMYPESLRKLMRTRETIDFIDLATEKTALFIITSPVITSLSCFCNLVYGTAAKQLLRFAAECPDCRLPREVRLVFDDFAVSSKIHNFSGYLSVFRSAGISAILLLQSESQLYALYGQQDGQTIINNVSTYCYFSGGMDLTTCEHVAKRVNKSLDTILYSPLDRIYIMQAGQKPKITSRYPILQDERYLRMQRSGAEKGGRQKTRERS